MTDSPKMPNALFLPIAQGVCADLVAASETDQLWDGDLAGMCVHASFILRDALRAVGLPAEVRAGYFAVDSPNPETCFCGRWDDEHDRACYFEAHAWVISGDWLLDLTAFQFADQTDEPIERIEIRPRIEATSWLDHLPRGVRGSKTWRTGLVEHFIAPPT
jgi:hypothetical protein